MVMACANKEPLLHDIIERRMRGGAATEGRKRMHLLSDHSKEQLMTGKVAEIEKSWKSYTCISADYFKKEHIHLVDGTNKLSHTNTIANLIQNCIISFGLYCCVWFCL